MPLGPDEPPAIQIPLSGSLFQTLVGASIWGLILPIEQPEIWAAIIDPTSAGDPYVNPATDRGPTG